MGMKYVNITKVLSTAVINTFTRYPKKRLPYINIIMGLKLVHVFLVPIISYFAAPLNSDIYGFIK